LHIVIAILHTNCYAILPPQSKITKTLFSILPHRHVLDGLLIILMKLKFIRLWINDLIQKLTHTSLTASIHARVTVAIKKHPKYLLRCWIK